MREERIALQLARVHLFKSKPGPCRGEVEELIRVSRKECADDAARPLQRERHLQQSHQVIVIPDVPTALASGLSSLR